MGEILFLFISFIIGIMLLCYKQKTELEINKMELITPKSYFGGTYKLILQFINISDISYFPRNASSPLFNKFN